MRQEDGGRSVILPKAQEYSRRGEHNAERGMQVGSGENKPSESSQSDEHVEQSKEIKS